MASSYRMKLSDHISRRSFLAMVGTAPLARPLLAMAGSGPLAFAARSRKQLPIGLELYSVRDELAKDLMGTVRAVAKMGYQVVEFYAPYYRWTAEYAREVRKLLDDLGIRCLSTHNGAESFAPGGLDKAIELNHILGAKYIVMASPPPVSGLDGYRKVADQLSQAAEKLKPLGMRTGFHNHKPDFVAVEGKRPIEVLASGTPREVVLQLDVANCLEAGADPVAWIKCNPGRTKSMHIKDWTAAEGKGYRVLLGEGDAHWAEIIKAAESKGGVEYYLIEQEGSRYSSLETAERCLAAWKKMRT
jgi:sugar phosphate isomerase/epimerase